MRVIKMTQCTSVSKKVLTGPFHGVVKKPTSQKEGSSLLANSSKVRNKRNNGEFSLS